MSPWGMFNTNAGNVPLSNSIFNSTFSSDGSSGVGTSDGGISNGGLSVGDAGGGMGESFNPDLKLNLHYTKSLDDYLTSTEQEFIRNNIDLIDSESWSELRDKVNDTFDYPLTTIAIFKFLADGLGYASRRGDAIAYSDNLTEAKKRKNKRKNQTQNDPVFKNIDDMKKWVKKR